MDLDDAPELAATADLRWSDFDRLGHLNQAVYHVLLEVGRTRWLTHVRPAGLGPTDAFVLARVELDHLREVDTSHAQVEVTCQAVALGSSSVTCLQEVRHLDGTVAARARCVMVGWDAAARGKRIFGDDERAGFRT